MEFRVRRAIPGRLVGGQFVPNPKKGTVEEVLYRKFRKEGYSRSEAKKYAKVNAPFFGGAKNPKKTVKIMGHTVTVGTKKHQILLQQKRIFDDLAKHEQGTSSKNPIEAKVGEKWEYAYRARKGGKWRTLFATSIIKSIRKDGLEIEFTNGRTITNYPHANATEGLVRQR